MKVTVARHAHFNAAHRLNNPQWDEGRNKEVFGKCNNPSYHGHNYEMIVKVKGPIDPATGYVMDMKVLAELTDRLICDRFDHKNLNTDTDEFRNINPTAENIAVVIWHLLRPEIDQKHELTVVLYETPRNFVEFSGE